jgi:hypothetical protein
MKSKVPWSHIHPKVSRSPLWLIYWLLRNLCVTNDHGYVPIPSFFLVWWFITRTVTWAGTSNPPGAHEFTPVIGGVPLAQSLVCLCSVLEINVCPFVLFPLASDYHLLFSNFSWKLPSPFSQMAFFINTCVLC